jgi:4-methoxybenzoate monooxygenase (O-demethylating)
MQSSELKLTTAVTSSLDPFGRGFLEDPLPFHEELREAAPAVWLEKYGIWGLARYEHVYAALSDWQTFCSARGVGLSDFVREKPWRPPSLLLEADPPLHTRTRGAIVKVLSRPALANLQAGFEAAAERLVARLLEIGSFDGITALAQAFPLSVFPDAMGVSREGRENLLPYGEMAFNAFGPRNWLFEESMVRAAPVTTWIMSQCRRESLAPGGLGAAIHALADAGDITHEEAGLLVRSLLTAGLDTTIYSLGAALHCFATHPAQWQRLREQPTLIRSAFDEVVRYASPVQTFFRTTTREVDVAGQQFAEGDKVLLFLGAANRDPRKWEESDRFHIERRTRGHVGFGYGIHMCVGQMLARLEAEVLLAAMARRIATIELTGKPTWRLNNTLRGLASLPVRIRAN